jgi:DNA-binding MltR family transcriptional regulator
LGYQMLSHAGIGGNIASRAKLCYTLGLITKSAFTEVITLAELRNMLAHTPQKLTFYSSEVQEAVLEMKWLHSWIERNYGPMPQFTDSLDKKIQNKFTTTIAILCNELKAIAEKIEKRRAAAEELSMFHIQLLNNKREPLNEVPQHLKDRAAAANKD